MQRRLRFERLENRNLLATLIATTEPSHELDLEALSINSNGDGMIVWTDKHRQDPNVFITAKAHLIRGNQAYGEEFELGLSSDVQMHVDCNENGDCVVGWGQFDDRPDDGHGGPINYMAIRRYDRDGGAIDEEIWSTFYDDTVRDVAINSNRDVVVLSQQYNSSRRRIGSKFFDDGRWPTDVVLRDGGGFQALSSRHLELTTTQIGVDEPGDALIFEVDGFGGKTGIDTIHGGELSGYSVVTVKIDPGQGPETVFAQRLSPDNLLFGDLIEVLPGEVRTSEDGNIVVTNKGEMVLAWVKDNEVQAKRVSWNGELISEMSIPNQYSEIEIRSYGASNSGFVAAFRVRDEGSRDFRDLFIATPIRPQIQSVVINAELIDPPDLPERGLQPTSWRQQRSSIESITIEFSEAILATADDFTLTNLGINAPIDADQSVALDADNFQIAGSTVKLLFEPDELTDGVYQLDISDSVADLDGNQLEGGEFNFVGNADNKFYQLEAEWSGDDGVSVFDFETFGYWFGVSTVDEPLAPRYADLNRDGGVSVFDFGGYSGNFGTGVIYPAGIAALVVIPAEEIVESKQRREAIAQVVEIAATEDAWSIVARERIVDDVNLDHQRESLDELDLELEAVIDALVNDLARIW